jgi:hypothetical protein
MNSVFLYGERLSLSSVLLSKKRGRHGIDLVRAQVDFIGKLNFNFILVLVEILLS